MPSLKDVKMKIVGVRKTKQITKAMNMVASAKLRGAQSRIERFRPYAEKFQAVLGDLAAKSDGSAHALLERRAECHVSVIILATSDRGLCGGFNAMGSDYPNQINNVLAFPGIFKGALEARVPSITPEMKVAVAKAIADTISDEDLNEENIMPKIFNKDVTAAVADAIKQFAK